MLGQLFNSLNPSRRATSQQAPALESVTEDSHTRNLLFPDPNTLSQAPGQAYPLQSNPDVDSAALLGPYDGKKGDFDLESARDVRIVVAQEEVGLLPRSILFDSKSISSGPPTPVHGRRLSRGSSVATWHDGMDLSNPPRSAGLGLPKSRVAVQPAQTGSIDSRKSSLTGEPISPGLFGGTGLQRNRRRNVSNVSMPNIEEQLQGRVTRDSNEELRTCLDCMFGSASLSYKGPSTKLHILPLEPKTSDSYSISGLDTSSSFGRAEGRKRSQLVKSYTVGASSSAEEVPETRRSRGTLREGRRRTILITRTFSVPLPSSDDSLNSMNELTPTFQNSLPKSGGSYPFPNPEMSPRVGNRRPKQRRSPMYAICVIMQLPTTAATTGPSSRPGFSSAGPRPSSSLRGHDSLASSVDSDRRHGWTILDPVFDFEQVTASLTTSDADDGIDYVVRHWDVISRTLTSMQFVIQDKIEALLKAAEGTASPAPQMRSNFDSQPRSVQRKMHPLQPGALSTDEEVRKLSDHARKRIVRGVEIPRVVTGQARWGVWRDEARQVGRWAGTREQNFFFFNLLTAFLGTHTDWLTLLGPVWYRRRYHEQQRSSPAEDLTISSRTVIVASDKMIARRLVFLLSAFMPSSLASRSGGFLGRPGSSASFRAQSQSPPTGIHVGRQPSLRRTINRRGKPTRSSGHASALGRESSPIRHEALDDSSHFDLAKSSHLTARSRRSSDAQSIRTANLAMPPIDGGRKSSAATASTVTPTSALPVAHFTLPRAATTSNADPSDRPDSSDSLVSVNLMQTLQRNNSAQMSSNSNESQTRWGSLMSSFWSSSNRRGSTTSTSEVQSSGDDGLGISGVAGAKRHLRKSSGSNKLQQMVHEVSTADGDFFAEDLEDHQLTDNDTALPSPIRQHPPEHTSKSSATTPAQAIPERSSVKSPLKLSVDEHDGVIDVDVGLGSFGSPMQSPSLGGYPSASSLEASSYGHMSVCSGPPVDTDQPVNVAGWLKHFHEDFALQSVRQYDDLEADIRRAMSSEPTPITQAATPSLENGPADKWVDVCSTLIADTHTFSIKRLRLRRRVRLIPAPSQPAITPGPYSVPSRGISHHHSSSNASSQILPVGPILPMTEHHLEEQFFEEPVMDMDGTLVDAVERVLAHSSTAVSSAPSAASSRSSSRKNKVRTMDSRPVEMRNPPSEAAAPIAAIDHGVTPTQAALLDGEGQSAQSHTSPLVQGNENLEVPRQECRKTVLGALEQVAKSVQAESKHRGRDTIANDSTLREGVRKWLNEVEEGFEAQMTPLAVA